MKKLALMAAVAAITASPAFADTGYSTTKQRAETSPPGHSYTVIDRDMSGDTVRYVTTTVTPPKTLPNGEFDFSGNYKIEDGKRLVIDGKTAYILNDDGYRYYAPTSGYVTEKGETFFIENGKLLRMEAPPEIVYVDTDDIVE